MTPPADFGAMLTMPQVERRVTAHLQAWMATALGAVERIEDIPAGKLQEPRSWDRSDVFEKFDEADLPNVVVVCPGMTQAPSRDGEGKWRAWFGVVVGCVVSGLDHTSTRDLAGWYGQALALAMTRPGIEGARGVTWGGLETDVLPFDASRTLGGVRVPFDIEFEDVLEAFVGPTVPLASPLTPPTDAPDVTAAEVSVNRVGVGDPLTDDEGDDTP